MARPWLLALLFVGALVPGCSHDPIPPSPAPPVKTGPAVSFVDDSPLTLLPGQQATMSVRVDPVTAGTLVRFTLRDDSGDASLLAASDTTDDRGEARVMLQAPRQARQFHLRASLDEGATDDRLIEVTTMGLVSVQATVLYTGHRTSESSLWTGTVEVDQGGCHAKASPPLITMQGSLPLSLGGIPTGTPLLVRIRSGDVVTGCTSLELTPADDGRLFEVPVDNTPIRPEPPLLMTLTPEPDPMSWKAMLDAWRLRFRQAFLGGRSGESAPVQSLLDTMVLLAPASQRVAIQQARTELGWESLAAAFFQQNAGPASALGWLNDAADQLLEHPDVITGRLALTSTTVTFSPDLVLGLESDDVLEAKPALWSATLDDKVQLNGEVSWQPARLLAGVAEAHAGLGYNGGATRLRELTPCADLASQLGSVEGCSTPCLTELCTQAVGEMWTRAADSDHVLNAQATLSFVASGSATLNGNRLTGFAGTGIWLGTLKDTQGTTGAVSFTGPASVLALPITSP